MWMWWWVVFVYSWMCHKQRSIGQTFFILCYLSTTNSHPHYNDDSKRKKRNIWLLHYRWTQRATQHTVLPSFNTQTHACYSWNYFSIHSIGYTLPHSQHCLPSNITFNFCFIGFVGWTNIFRSNEDNWWILVNLIDYCCNSSFARALVTFVRTHSTPLEACVSLVVCIDKFKTVSAYFVTHKYEIILSIVQNICNRELLPYHIISIYIYSRTLFRLPRCLPNWYSSEKNNYFVQLSNWRLNKGTNTVRRENNSNI